MSVVADQVNLHRGDADKKLPHGWYWVRLGDVCDRIDYGYTASADFGADGPRFLRITDIQNGHVDWDKVPGCRISPEDAEHDRLADGDIVFARTGGTTGKSFLVRRPPRAVFASYLIRLRPADSALAEYLSAFFQSDEYWHQIRAAARGGAQPNVNASLLGKLLIPLPPLAEQKRIAGVLSEQMADVARARQALVQQLQSTAALPAAYLREVFTIRKAKQWHWVRLAEILREARNGLYKHEAYYGRGTRILKMFNIGRFSGQWNLERVDLVELSTSEEEAYRLRAGDILINRVNSRELVGKCAVVDESTAGSVFESKNIRLRLNTDSAFPPFIATWINSQGTRLQFEARMKQIVGQATLNRSDFGALSIPLPPLAVQKEIAGMLLERSAHVDQLCVSLESQLTALNHLPAALLRRAFNGEI